MRIALRNAILPLIRGATRIMVIAHIAPDGDCIGSLLALGHALKVLDKQVTMVCADPVPETFSFLPGHNLIIQEIPVERLLPFLWNLGSLMSMPPICCTICVLSLSKPGSEASYHQVFRRPRNACLTGGAFLL